MKNMKKLTAQSVPPRYTGNHPKRKQLLRLGCAALALTLAMVTGIMTGILPGIGMTVHAETTTYTITWEYETFRTLPSGGTQNGITFSGDKSDYSTNVYSSQITFTAPEGSVFTKIEFPTTATNISDDSTPNTGTFSVVDYSFYSTKDRRDVDGKMVTWTGNSDVVSFTNFAYAIEYITFTLYDEPPHEHTWEWVTDTEPTCGQPGTKHQECTVCHATQSTGTEIPATGNHIWEWVTDTDPTCGAPGTKHEECTVCHATQSTGTEIPATGNHTWEWVTDTEPTATEPGEKHEECTVCHAKQNEHTEIPALGVDDYSFTADSAFKWTKGSSDGLKMVIKNTSGDDTATFGKFKDVYVDGAKLTRDTDYTAEPGSIEITLSAAYLEALSTGKHTLKVELTVTTIEHTFTVTAPASTDTPSTGESIAWVICSAVLMLLAVCGAVYAVKRRTVCSL